LIDPSEFANLVPRSLYQRSGSVFYSGRGAFSKSSPLYILGLNPGGSPIDQAHETVEQDLADWHDLPERWSAYRDESWRGRTPGSYGMQPRVLHLLKSLDLHPHDVPASNVVFVRSNREATLSEKSALLQKCWPVHNAVIKRLGVKTTICFGGTAGGSLRELTGAHRKIAEFVEQNARRWRSEAHVSRAGVCVVTVTHPSIADWRNPASDPTPVVKAALERA
jgi:hypothetical protein